MYKIINLTICTIIINSNSLVIVFQTYRLIHQGYIRINNKISLIQLIRRISTSISLHLHFNKTFNRKHSSNNNSVAFQLVKHISILLSLSSTMKILQNQMIRVQNQKMKINYLKLLTMIRTNKNKIN